MGFQEADHRKLTALKTKAPAEPPIVPGIPLPINYLIQP